MTTLDDRSGSPSISHGFLTGSTTKARRASEFEAHGIETLHHRVSSPLPDRLELLDESPFDPAERAYPSVPTTPHGHPARSRADGTYFEKTLGGSGKGETPLPYMKMLPLIVARLSEGLIYSVIFPYINEMVRDFGIPEEKVGVWSSMAVCRAVIFRLLES